MALFSFGYFSQMVYEKAEWDYRGFALEADLRAAVEKTARALDATSADLGSFRARGGKLVLYHGWQDPAIPAVSTTNYYGRVVARAGKRASDGFVRLYMAPGVQHCGDGPGPSVFGQAGDFTSDDVTRSLRVSLEQWVEKSTAPSTIVATKYEGEEYDAPKVMTRPLCPYPQVARSKGTGDTNDAASFVCAAPQLSR